MNASMNILPARRPRRAAWKALFVVAVMIASSMAAVGSASAAGVCSITVNTPNLTPLHASYDGTATYNGPQSNIYSFTVNWGDGTTDNIPVVDIPATGIDPFSWSVSHDYAAAGSYSVAISMVHANPQGQDVCAGAYTASVDVPPPPPPPGPEICGNGIDDNQNGQIDEGCTPPPPPPAQEICGNGIDDNNNGVVDENCPTNGGGGSTGGTSSSGGTKVLGKVTKKAQAPLATTGAATTAAAWLGAVMLMLGLAMRFVRAPRSVSAVFAGQGSAAAEMQRFGLYLQAQPTARRWFRR